VDLIIEAGRLGAGGLGDGTGSSSYHSSFYFIKALT